MDKTSAKTNSKERKNSKEMGKKSANKRKEKVDQEIYV